MGQSMVAKIMMMMTVMTVMMVMKEKNKGNIILATVMSQQHRPGSKKTCAHSIIPLPFVTTVF